MIHFNEVKGDKVERLCGPFVDLRQFRGHGIALIMDQLTNSDTAKNMKNRPLRSPAFHSRGYESTYPASHDHLFHVARVYIELAQCAHVGQSQ
jgi:hypothetical protein